MIKTIRPYIDLNWYTVPLGGELKRLANGKKTLPMFPDNWNVKFAKDFNKEESALGGVITGELSNIIAIDCDDTTTYNLFKALDPSYGFHFVSKGKKDNLGGELQAGIIIYKYSPEVKESFRLNTANMRLDFYSTGGFVYLPSAANKTKEPFELVELKEAPAEILALLKSLKPTKLSVAERELSEKTWVNHLAPQLSNFVRAKKVIPNLFRVLTPKDFRDLDEYLDKKYLAPDDVPEGRGSEYLSKISAILGADPSIDVDLYIEAMEIINSMFSDPMPKVRLSSTIVEPMVEERAAVDGVPIWQYDEHWQEGKLQLISKRNEIVDTFYDPNRMAYYAADVLAERSKSFNREQEFCSYLEALTIDPPGRKEIKSSLPLVDVVSTPAKPFGFFTDTETNAFNTFAPSIALAIFKDPTSYTDKYTRPTAILQFLESLVPDNYMRNYLLRFLRRKLDKFEYSPVVLYFLGVPGAGKDTIVKLIEAIIGEDSLARPTVKEFLEMYNGWLLDKYFVQLDEYGNQLTRYDEKENALGKIKAYTGKNKVQIRQMRTDGFNYIHNATFIMTANRNPLFVEGDDRRMALFSCPNNLREESWVQSFGGVAAVQDAIENEINDLAYYLATEVDNLSHDEYMTPPDTEDKKKLIANAYGAGQRIAFLLANGMFFELEEIAVEHDSLSIFDNVAEGRVYEVPLQDLYYEMTDGKGTKRGLNACMKEFSKVPTTLNNQKSYYYDIPNLRKYRPKKTFSKIDEE